MGSKYFTFSFLWNQWIFLKYASGATGTDSSGQGNTQTVAGTITSLKDTPDDNYCTLNPLDINAYSSNQLQYTEVMNTVVANGNNWKSTVSTMGQCTGKFYFETKIIGASTNWWVGIVDPSQIQYVSGSKNIQISQEVMVLIILLIKVIVVVK